MTSANSKQKQKAQSLKQMSKKKKIGFLSAIMFVVGSSIGAGIFLKNGEIMTNTHYSIVFAVLAWLIAFVGILAMGLSLVEIVSSSKNDNREGIAGWVRTFNGKYLYLGCRNFMAYVYTPINAFAMPYYAIQQLSDGIGWKIDWYVVALIAFAIMVYFLITTTLSSKLTNLHNWITLIIKFLPLIVAAILGFIFLAIGKSGVGGDYNHALPVTSSIDKKDTYFNNLVPALGIFMSIPSVLFVVDGFYSCTAMQTSMAEPKKMDKAILIGLICILSIDVLIAVSLMFGSSQGGGISSFKNGLPDWLYKILQILISIGILGVINGICAYTAKMYEQMIEDKTLIFSKRVSKWFNGNKTKIVLFYVLGINISVFVIATIIGCFFINTSVYGEDYFPECQKLYSFVDLTGNWTALFAFCIITIAILGGLINRKTKKIKTEQSKSFVPAAIVTISIFSISILMEVIKAIGNLYLSVDWFNTISSELSHTEAINRLVGSILMLLTMIFFMVVLFFPCCPWYKKKAISIQ